MKEAAKRGRWRAMAFVLFALTGLAFTLMILGKQKISVGRPATSEGMQAYSQQVPEDIVKTLSPQITGNRIESAAGQEAAATAMTANNHTEHLHGDGESGQAKFFDPAAVEIFHQYRDAWKDIETFSFETEETLDPPYDSWNRIGSFQYQRGGKERYEYHGKQTNVLIVSDGLTRYEKIESPAEQDPQAQLLSRDDAGNEYPCFITYPLLDDRISQMSEARLVNAQGYSDVGKTAAQIVLRRNKAETIELTIDPESHRLMEAKWVVRNSNEVWEETIKDLKYEDDDRRVPTSYTVSVTMNGRFFTQRHHVIRQVRINAPIEPKTFNYPPIPVDLSGNGIPKIH